MRFEVAPACENTDFSFIYFLSPVAGLKNTIALSLNRMYGLQKRDASGINYYQLSLIFLHYFLKLQKMLSPRVVGLSRFLTTDAVSKGHSHGLGRTQRSPRGFGHSNCN
jgi:hypothetical protein